MFVANKKKLRSLRSLRRNWLFIANKTPLASLAPSKCVSLLIKNDRSLRSLRQSFFVLQIFSPAGTVHFLLHIYMDHAGCKCNMR